MGKYRISLKDIADACGVSRNTVSLALRNSPRLKVETRKRIQKQAEEMGYRQDPELGKLMTRLREPNKQEVQAEIAYVHTLPLQHGKLPQHAYVKPAGEWLLKKGYRLRGYNLYPGEGMSLKELSRILLARGVEGILVSPMPPRVSRIDLPWEKFSGVAFGRALDTPCLPKVDADAFAAMRMCYQKLKEKGCKRIGAIIPSLYDELIRDAYRSAFWGRSSLEPKSRRVEILDVNRPRHRELTQAEFEAWRKKYQVDGVICLTGDFQNLQSMGYEMQGEIRTVVLNLHGPEVPCAGVMTHDREIGIAAASQLLFAIQHGIRGAWDSQNLTLIRGKWYEPERL